MPSSQAAKPLRIDLHMFDHLGFDAETVFLLEFAQLVTVEQVDGYSSVPIAIDLQHSAEALQNIFCMVAGSPRRIGKCHTAYARHASGITKRSADHLVDKAQCGGVFGQGSDLRPI